MFCVRFSVSRIMLFDFSSINIPLAKKNTSHQSFLYVIVCGLSVETFYVIVTKAPLLQPGHLSPILPRGKTGLAEYPILIQNKTLSGPCTDVQNSYIYIYTYTHNYNCIYALLVPRCTLDHLSVYVCFLPELAQHLGCIGMNITISPTPWPAHLATSPYKSDGNGKKLSLSEWDSSPKKEGKK